MKYNYQNPFDVLVLRYNEIGLKGGNRKRFEKVFIKNIKKLLREIEDLTTLQDRGRIVLARKGIVPFTEEQQEIIAEELHKAFGLSSYSPAFMCKPKWKAIRSLIGENFPGIYAQHDQGGPVRFRTRARRSYKKFPYTSKELEIAVAEHLVEDFPQIQIDLSNPEVSIGVEVREEMSFIYFEDVAGPGGLPVGTSENVLSLMSGGIDSPVACYHAMKRGCHVDYLTFHSHPYTSRDGLAKIAGLVYNLNGYQNPGAYLACNMVSAQKAIRDNCNSRMRTVLYRRIMMRVATVVAHHMHCKALLTGEALGQVASQTLINMDAINRSTDMLILRPLVGSDKNDAIDIARKINTLDQSNLPGDDSCTVFAPESPATSGNIHLCRKNERYFDLDQALRDCLNDVIRIHPLSLEETPVDGEALIAIYDEFYKEAWLADREIR